MFCYVNKSFVIKIRREEDFWLHHKNDRLMQYFIYVHIYFLATTAKFFFVTSFVAVTIPFF